MKNLNITCPPSKLFRFMMQRASQMCLDYDGKPCKYDAMLSYLAFNSHCVNLGWFSYKTGQPIFHAYFGQYADPWRQVSNYSNDSLKEYYLKHQDEIEKFYEDIVDMIFHYVKKHDIILYCAPNSCWTLLKQGTYIEELLVQCDLLVDDELPWWN